MNKQREAVYGLRRQLLEGEDQKEYVMGIGDDIMIELVSQFANENTHADEWDLEGLHQAVIRQFGFDFRAEGINPDEMGGSKEIEEALLAKAHEKYDHKETIIGSAPMRYHERMLMLQIVDTHWKDHLLAMDHLKEGIGLRGYGQRDPLVEYKKESYELFEGLMGRIEEDTLRFLYLLQPVEEKKQAEQMEKRRRRAEFAMTQQAASNGGDGTPQQAKRDASKVGRNDPCPCGSGKKFKKCHGVTV
jgi:preprotein translocase subunit SecA